MRVASSRYRIMWRLLAAVSLAAAAAVVLAGCGGSSPNQQLAKAPVQRSHQTPAQSNPDVGSAGAQVSHHSHLSPSDAAAVAAPRSGADSSRRSADGGDRVGPQSVHQALPTPASSSDDKNTANASPLNPCTLVSLTQAQAITDGAVSSRVEAPLGPTCIYKGNGTKEITLAVEVAQLSKVTRHMTKRTKVSIGTRQAYCGKLGTPMLFVPLSAYQVLNVTAPCGIARRFAGLALSDLAA